MDNLAPASALGAGLCGSKNTHGRLAAHLCGAVSVTLRANFRRRPLGASTAAAFRTILRALNHHFFFAAESRFLKTDGNRGPDRFPTHRAVAPGLPAAEPAAEETAENITQIAEIEIAGKTAAIAARTTVIGIDAGKAELIILRLFVRIA